MEVLDLGQRKYQEVWALQKDLVVQRAENKISDTLILVEHEPVYTLGRGSSLASPTVFVPKKTSVPVIEIERGGKMTFHGPGQLVGYPIFYLHNRDLRAFLRAIERILMDTVRMVAGLEPSIAPKDLELTSGQLPTGIWIENRKLASIGIAVKQWVSYHGFALNLQTDLDYFRAIEPCGFHGSQITTLEQELVISGKRFTADMNMQFREKLISGFQTLSDESLGMTNRSQLSASDSLSNPEL